mgnify:CR=1 FL=1
MRILIADDHEVVCRGFEMLLNYQNDMERLIVESVLAELRKNGANILGTVMSMYDPKANKTQIKQAVEKKACEYAGSIIMEPTTGNILAMASYPNYDLNNPRELSAYYEEDVLNEMSEEELREWKDNADSGVSIAEMLNVNED